MAALTGCKSNPPQPPAPASASIPVRMAAVDIADLPRTISVTGSIIPEFQADIATRTPGRVDKVFVHEGDFVKHGQPLIALEARDLDAAVAEAQSNVTAAESEVGNATAALAMEDATSPARIRDAKAKIAAAESALRTAQAQRDLVMAGPRPQERSRAAEAVAEAKASLVLATTTYQRMKRLYAMEAISGQQFDEAKSTYDSAQAQYQSAVLAQSQTDEGSRSEEKRAATSAVGQAMAAVMQARAGLAQARAASMNVDVRRADLERARSGVIQARAALQMAIANRAYATIVAPFDGVITQRGVDPGAMAGPGVTLLKLEGGALRLDANVPETALPFVHVGSTIPVYIDALGGKQFAGSVVRLARQGDVTSHTFTAKIQLPPGTRARSGMYARADVVLGVDRVPVVPSTAIVSRDGLSYVYVVGSDNVARLRFVTTGQESDGRVPILSGASAGDRVVVRGVNRVRDNVRIASSGS